MLPEVPLPSRSRSLSACIEASTTSAPPSARSRSTRLGVAVSPKTSDYRAGRTERRKRRSAEYSELSGTQSYPSPVRG